MHNLHKLISMKSYCNLNDDNKSPHHVGADEFHRSGNFLQIDFYTKVETNVCLGGRRDPVWEMSISDVKCLIHRDCLLWAQSSFPLTRLPLRPPVHTFSARLPLWQAWCPPFLAFFNSTKSCLGCCSNTGENFHFTNIKLRLRGNCFTWFTGHYSHTFVILIISASTHLHARL